MESSDGLTDCMRNATLSVKVVRFHAIKTCKCSRYTSEHMPLFCDWNALIINHILRSKSRRWNPLKLAQSCFALLIIMC
jgi:hypothetical protein